MFQCQFSVTLTPSHERIHTPSHFEVWTTLPYRAGKLTDLSNLNLVNLPRDLYNFENLLDELILLAAKLLSNSQLALNLPVRFEIAKRLPSLAFGSEV